MRQQFLLMKHPPPSAARWSSSCAATRSALTLCLSLLPRRAGVLLLHAQDSDHSRGAADLELRVGPPAGEDASLHTDIVSQGNVADGRSLPSDGDSWIVRDRTRVF